MDTPHSDNEQQQYTTAPKADVIPKPLDSNAAAPGETDTEPADSGITPAPSSVSDASLAISAKLAKLEEHLQGIGKTLTLHMGKEEVLTRSLVELESKIKKIERSIQEPIPVKASPAPETLQTSEVGSEGGGLQETLVDTIPLPGKSTMSSSSRHSDGGSDEQWEPLHDFSSSVFADHDEPPDFLSEASDVFAAPSDSEDRLLSGDRLVRSGGAGKKPYLIIIPVVSLLALFLFLVFYYNGLQKQADTKLTITERISISSVPADMVASQPAPPTGDAQPSEPEPALSDTPVVSPASIPEAKIKEAVTSSISPQANSSPKSFTVAVGSFREKNNAIALTSQLSKKGYPAQMTLVKPKKLFRVTVGTFASRKEASVMAAQLQQKEQLKTALIDLSKP